MQQETNQMQVVQQGKPYQLAPTSLNEAMQIAKLLADSNMVPKDYRGKPEDVLVTMFWGQDIGLAPLQSLQNISNINGRPGLWGDAALAVAMAHPAFEDIEELWDEGSKVATCIIKRKGRSQVRRTFGMQDAKAAGLASKQGPWTQYPIRMCQMRARGFALRDCFPDALRGLKLAEELIGEVDITPQSPERQSVAKPQAKASAAPEQPAPTYSDDDVQDAEIVEQHGEQQQDRQPEPQPQPQQQAEPLEGVPTMTTGQLKIARIKLGSASISEAQACASFGVYRLEALPASRCNDLLEWIKKGGQ